MSNKVSSASPRGVTVMVCDAPIFALNAPVLGSRIMLPVELGPERILHRPWLPANENMSMRMRLAHGHLANAMESLTTGNVPWASVSTLYALKGLERMLAESLGG